MKIFIGPVVDRTQYSLLKETLEDSIPSDHPVRVLDWVLDQMDWSEWIAQYPGGGRPAYPPDVMAKLLIYAYMVGMRSSRMTEHACRNSMDFMWLMSGRKPDHDTIATFRRENVERFVDVFKATVAVCREAGLVAMEGVAVDGTRVEANNGRDSTMKREEIEKELKKLEERVRKIVGEAEAKDREEDALFGEGVSPNNLPKELKDAEKRRERMEKALEKVKAKNERESGRLGKKSKGKNNSRVPVVDVDSDVMKDKKGSFGPNYNPYVAVDGLSGVIVSCGVTNQHNDAGHLKPAIEEAEENTGMSVAQVRADSAYATAENLEYCEGRGVDPCMAPLFSSPGRKPGRKDLPEGVPQTAVGADGDAIEVGKILRGNKGKFDKLAFKYDHETDCYMCPLGHSLKKVGETKSGIGGETRTRYRCGDCCECPVRAMCTTNRRGREVCRSWAEEVRVRHHERMKDPKHKADYRLRKQVVEPAVGIIKHVMGVRRFHLRGLTFVDGEWDITCTAFNIKKVGKWAQRIGLKGLTAIANA
jgi:transposase